MPALTAGYATDPCSGRFTTCLTASLLIVPSLIFPLPRQYSDGLQPQNIFLVEHAFPAQVDAQYLRTTAYVGRFDFSV